MTSESNYSVTDLYEKVRMGGTCLGPSKDWPAEIDILVRNALCSEFPICFAWGASGVQIYNDAYIPIFGEKHPQSFGAPVRESWREIWDFLEPALESIRSTKRPLWFSDTLLPLNLSGHRPEECYFDFSYSPVISTTGSVLGVMSIASRRTSDVILRRRKGLPVLEHLPDIQSDVAVGEALRAMLAGNPMDCAAAALYSADTVTGVLTRPMWTIGLDAKEAEIVRPIVCRAARGPGISVVFLGDDRPTASESGCVVPLYHLDGTAYGALLIVPNVLVRMEDGLINYAHVISSQFHAALHAAQDRQAKLGRAMEERDKLYEFFFENIADGAFVSEVGEEEVVIAANNAACEMLGYDEDELIGMRRETLFHPDDNAVAKAVMNRTSHRVFVGELCFRHKDGSDVVVEGSSSFAETPYGRRAVTIIRDRAHQKAAERERAERVRRETVTNLAGGLAHDFNNLLTVISGSVEMILPELDVHSVYGRAAHNALLASDRARGLTGQLLSYTRQQPLAPALVDINVFLTELQGLLHASLTEVNALRLSLASDDLWCKVDVTHLTTALINIATNSRDAMPGGGTLIVETEIRDSSEIGSGSDGYSVMPGNYACIAATDTGTGMSEASAFRAFELFFTTKDTGRGSGLGLPMVQGFARQSGGDARLYSTPNLGTRVELILPLNGAPPETCSASDAKLHVMAGIHVLCVEDNDLVRSQAVMMLKGLGFKVTAACHAPQAMDFIDAGLEFDVLFTDLVMPGGVSGLELSHTLRQRFPKLPVLVTTGRDPDAATATMRDAFSVLAKPYTRSQLNEGIAAAVRLVRAL